MPVRILTLIFVCAVTAKAASLNTTSSKDDKSTEVNQPKFDRNITQIPFKPEDFEETTQGSEVW